MTTTAALHVQEVRDAAELLVLAETFEPRTTHLVDALLEQPPRRRRIHVVRGVDGSILGALVVSRLCRDRWLAFPLVLDVAVGPALAQVADRSPAYSLIGLQRDVDPVAAHLHRHLRRMDLAFSSMELPRELDVQPDARTRFAVEADVPALVELYSGFEIDIIPTRRRLRQVLERDVARGRVVVMEEDGRLAGAYCVEAGTRRYHHWGFLSVHPDFRGRRFSSELAVRGLLHSRSLGVAACWARHPTNPLPPPDPDGQGRPFSVENDVWSVVRLSRRHPALNRARRVLELLEGARSRRPPAVIDEHRWEEARARRAGRPMLELFEETRAAEVDGTREEH